MRSARYVPTENFQLDGALTCGCTPCSGAIHQYGLAHGCLTSHSIACHLGPHGRPVCYTVDDFGLVPHLASSAAEGGVGTAQTVDVAAVAGIMAEALAGQELPPDFDPRTLPAMQRCVTAIPNIIVHALCSHNRIVTTFDEPGIDRIPYRSHLFCD